MRQLLGYARDFGNEQCGVIAGMRQGEEAFVIACAQLRNASHKPESNYEFDPDQQALVWEEVAKMGAEVLGVWHTHPHGPAHPSQTDVAYMTPWLVYPVLVPAVGRTLMTVYRLSDDGEGYVSVPHELRIQGL